MTIEESTKALNESVAMAISLAVEQERKKWVPYALHKTSCGAVNEQTCYNLTDNPDRECTCGLAKLLEEKP